MALLRKRKEKIEEQMMTFLNLIEYFSKTSDDIINILDRANQYMKDPLFSIVNDFVMEVRLYANLNDSFGRVCKSLDGTRMSEVFRILRICSEHDANYTEVVRDLKQSFKEYQKSQKIRKAIINSARIDMMALLFACYIVMGMLDDFLTIPAVVVCCESPIGIGILIYGIIIIGISVYYLWIKEI
ncbi:MAG: hypothetical protein ACI4AQ_03855 [Lachnospiraceae bacterium]